MMMTAGGPMMRAATKFADRRGADDASGKPDVAQMTEAANRVGSGFLALGVKQGDRIAVLSHNRLEVVHLWMGFERFNLPAADAAQPLRHGGARGDGAQGEARGAGLRHGLHRRRRAPPGRAGVRADYIAVGAQPPSWATPLAQVMERGRPEDDRSTWTRMRPASCSRPPAPRASPRWHRSTGAGHPDSHNLHHLDTFGPGNPQVGPDDVNLHLHALMWASGAQDDATRTCCAAHATSSCDDSVFDRVKYRSRRSSARA